jgi:putative ABC transport system substrate-binding protein
VIGRRASLALAFAAPGWHAAAQAPSQTQAKVGWLSVGEHPFVKDFRERLAELGLVEGKNLAIEYRYAKGNASLLPAMVESLAKAGVSVIVASGSDATDAAVSRAKGIPVLFLTSDSTIAGRRLSLARPGEAATGISAMGVDLASKKVALLRDAVKGLSRLALLDDGSPGSGRACEEMRAAAQRLGIESKTFTLREPTAFEPGFSRIGSEAWQASVAAGSPMFAGSARLLAELTKKHRLPALFDNPSFVHAGALMSYGPDLKVAFRRLAEMTERVVHGGRVTDIPLEQVSKFLFTFNQTTAKSLGLSLSLPVMASVDELVE